MQVQNETNRFFEITNDAAVADEIGRIDAEIKSLRDSRKFLEDLLKSKQLTQVDGSQYRVTISYDIIRKVVDYRGMMAAKEWVPTRQLLAAHTKISRSDRVSVKGMTR